MSAFVKNKYGKITFEDSCISTLAGVSATECYGLVGMSDKNIGATIANFFSGDGSIKRGVTVKTDNSDSVVIDLRITVKYGVPLLAVAESIIDKVKYSVEKDTGLSVKSVNVIVQGIEV